MAESTKKTSREKYKERYKDRYKPTRVDSTGQRCPKNTHLRDGMYGKVYYAKITIGGKQRSCNTGILESMPNSRKKVIQWVAAWRAELEKNAPPKRFHIHPGLESKLNEVDINAFNAPLKYTVGYAVELEANRFEEENPGSPVLSTVRQRLVTICKFFIADRDVRDITADDIKAYRMSRRSEHTRRGKPPTYDTIYRELELFERGVAIANSNGYLTDENFPSGYKLPINRSERKRLKKRDEVYDAQQSHAYTSEECERWLAAAKGTSVEHYAFLAYRTGLRHGELEALRWEWIHVTPRQAYYAEIRLPEWLYQKGCKIDDQPLPIERDLYDYIAALAAEALEGKPLLKKLNSKQRASRAVSKKLNGELYITLRDLRACYGWRVQERRGDVFLTMRAMRHRNIQTTINHYLKPGDAQRTLIANALSGSKPSSEK